MSTYQYMAVDPGPSTGIALLGYVAAYDKSGMPAGLSPWNWLVLQVNGGKAVEMIRLLLTTYQPAFLAMEKFIPSNRPGTKVKDAELTREISHQAEVCHSRLAESQPAPYTRISDIGEKLAVTYYPAAMSGGRYIARRATDVKPWATDARLSKTGFPMGPKFRDARDAGRHALYCAVRDGHVRDPLA